MSFVSQAATTTLTTQSVWPSNSRHMDITSNGVMWMGYTTVITGFPRLIFKYSSDNGQTWTQASTEIGNVTSDADWSLFIDQDDYMHVFYFDTTPAGKYRRGTPNAGRTLYTWGGDSTIVQASTAANCSMPDIVAHRESTGWAVHMVYYWADLSLFRDDVVYRRVALDAAGTATLPGTSLTYVDINGTGHIRPTIDFCHTGDGKTVLAGAPHVWIGKLSQRTGSSGFGLVSRKLVYGGTHTWNANTSVSLVQTLRPNNTSDAQIPQTWFTGFWDGTQFVLVGVAWDITAGAYQFFIQERNAADTTTTSKQKVTDLTMHAGGAGYDPDGNIYIIGQTLSQAVGSRLMTYRKWTRATNTLGATTTIDAAAWEHMVNVRRGNISLATRIDYLYNKNNTAPMPINYGAIDVNFAPTKASLMYPIGLQAYPKNQSGQFEWIFQDPDTGDSQSKYDIQYRLQGAASWTQVLNQVSTVPKHTFAAATFTTGDYEWQVRTYDAGGLASPWSNTGTFTSLDAPVDPTWVSPTVSGDINTNPYTLVWDTPTVYQQYQIQVVNPVTSAVDYDSGTVNSASESQSVTFPTNNVPRTLRVRVRKTGLWSAWVENTVNIAYNAPGQPTAINATWVDTVGLGRNNSLSVSVTHKVPTGSEPNVLKYDVWARPIGDTTPGLRIAKDVTPFNTISWLEPNLVPMEIRVYMYGDNAVNGYSTWVAATGSGIPINGFVLHDPVNIAGTITHVPLNDRGAEESIGIESTMLQFQGREYPVAEFGDASERKVQVPTVYSDSGQAEKIKALVLRRSVLCYRDHAGRKVYGMVAVHEESDTFWGKTSSLEITQVDWTEGV